MRPAKNQDQVRAHHMFSRILKFLFVIIFSRKKYLRDKEASYDIFIRLTYYENPFITDQDKQQISWEKNSFRRFRIRKNM